MKKGFTLTELLAVIVILAVIAVISTPLIIGVIDDSKKASYIDSTYGILDGVNKMIMNKQIDGTNQEYYQIDLTESDLKYSGKKPNSGTLLVDKNQNTSITLKYDNYCIEKKFNEQAPTIKEKEPCTIDNSEISSLTQYRDAVLNGADPVITGDLIPVVISSDGTVKKSSIENNYYSYSEKIWANAVILLDKGITYAIGDTIPESNIESYFVWIPRYKYKIFNSSVYTAITGVDITKEQEIEIVFENKQTTLSSGTNTGEWLTHPAFVSLNVNGIWVGKFETGYKGATTKVQAEINGNDSTKVIIKPNAYSWRNINVNNAYLTSYNYNRTLDSHMMKNTEWGAVAYLSRSVYGINGSIRINNNSSGLTGYAAINEPTCGYTGTMSTCNAWGSTTDFNLAYNNSTGILASTTGNISGIYDMSGGSWEYVMGFVFNESTPYYGNSGMSSLPDNKYYDKYLVGGFQNYSKRILGDATGEMGPFGTWNYSGVAYSDGVTPTSGGATISSWSKDSGSFPYASSYPWFTRGASYNGGTSAGIFSFYDYEDGGALSNISFRLVFGI